MKKHIIGLLVCILAMALIITGCGKSRDDVISGFNDILGKEAAEFDNVSEKLEALENYLDKNLKYVGKEDADYMVFNYIEEAYVQDNEYIVYSDIAERYGKYLTDMFNAQIEMEILEDESPITNQEDGGKLNYDWSEITARALLTEDIISEYKEKINSQEYEYMKEHILWHYKYYINLMLMGTSSNPLFSYETGEFDENAEAMYTSSMQSNTDTVVAWALNEYFTYLDSTDYKLDYENTQESKIYYNTCNYIVAEAGKRVFQ